MLSAFEAVAPARDHVLPESLTEFGVAGLAFGAIYGLVRIIERLLDYYGLAKKASSGAVISPDAPDYEGRRLPLDEFRSVSSSHATAIQEVRAGGEKLRTLVYQLRAKVDDLHRWHDVDDPENPGAKVWYSSRTQHLLESLQVEDEKLHGRVEKLVRIAEVLLEESSRKPPE